MIARTHTNLSPHFSEQIPRQEIPIENQSALHGTPHAAARFAGKMVTPGNGPA
jgi:hypothetical protein